MKNLKSLIAASTFALLAMANASATSYPFTVRCQNSASVEVWETGDIDPGQEYLRVITGKNFPGCSVSDYDPQLDGHLPKRSHSGAAAVWEGGAREILGRIFGF